MAPLSSSSSVMKEDSCGGHVDEGPELGKC